MGPCPPECRLREPPAAQQRGAVRAVHRKRRKRVHRAGASRQGCPAQMAPVASGRAAAAAGDRRHLPRAPGHRGAMQSVQAAGRGRAVPRPHRARGPPGAVRPFRDRRNGAAVQANFKNALATVARQLEAAVLGHARLAAEAVSNMVEGIASCTGKTRPGRSYPRVSKRPDDRFRNPNRKSGKAALPAA